MTTLREEIVAALGVRAVIDPGEEIDRRVGFLADYARASGAATLVLGISGGQDSSLAGRLAQLAAERLRDAGHEIRFLAVRLPHGVQHDADDALLALDFIAPDEAVSVDIAPPVAALSAEVETSGAPLSDFTRGNAKARMRMIVQYALAGDRRGLVIGTDHAAEAVTGFFTKFGDGGADVLPLSGLTKSQGAALLAELGADSRLWTKAPTADLLDGTPGRADEDELGLRYAEIDAYLQGEEVEAAVAEKIEGRYLATRHKRELPVTPADDWWKEGRR